MSFIPPSASLYHPTFGKIHIFANDVGLYKLTFTAVNLDGHDTGKTPELIHFDTSQSREFGEMILAFLEGRRQDLFIPIDWSIFPEFQKKVLQLAYAIPFGKVETYGKLADSLGSKNNSRAVGAALGKNPIPIVIPCHRVVGADGSLHGYSAPGGLATKAWLLMLEGHRLISQPEFKLVKDENGKF